MPKPVDSSQFLEMVGMYPRDNGSAATDSIYFSGGSFVVDTVNGLQVKGPGITTPLIIGGIQIAAPGAAAQSISFMNGATEEVRLFHGAIGTDGALTLYSQLNNTRSALDMGPTRGTLPVANALAEMVQYRTVAQSGNFERISYSAMATPSAYYIQVEAGGTGAFRDVRFLFVPSTVTTWVATPVGSSYPFAFDRGHIRFDTDNQQGAAATPWFGREGGGSLTINVPTSQSFGVKINNGVTAALAVTSGAATANGITINGAATTLTPSIAASGTDANIGLNLQPKGSGGVNIIDSNGLVVLNTQPGVASAVNNFQISNAATGNSPVLAAAGTDTNVSIRLSPKGTGAVDLNYPVVALGGGVAPTLGTIGGSGPATAAQNSWVRMLVQGVATFFPAWR